MAGLDTTELEELRATLIRMRARGIRSTLYDGKRIEYGTDAELASAIADLGARIARASTTSKPNAVRFNSSKGF